MLGSMNCSRQPSKVSRWPIRHAAQHRLLAVENLEARVLLSVTQPGTLNRPADPVVFTGNDVSSMIGIAPGDLVAFRDTGTGWQQVPVQVDERAMVTMYQIYGQTLGTPNLTILTYTDANTFVGADPDATIDANDEIVFMAKDTGGRVPSSQPAPADVDVASQLEIRVLDPLDAGQVGWVYLFRRASEVGPNGLSGTQPAEGIPLLRPPTEGQNIKADYSSIGLTLGRHPLALLRERFQAREVTTAAGLRTAKEGSRVRVAGLVIGRQSP